MLVQESCYKKVICCALVLGTIAAPRFVKPQIAEGGQISLPDCDSKAVILDCIENGTSQPCTDLATTETTSQTSQQRFVAGTATQSCAGVLCVGSAAVPDDQCSWDDAPPPGP